MAQLLPRIPLRSEDLSLSLRAISGRDSAERSGLRRFRGRGSVSPERNEKDYGRETDTRDQRRRLRFAGHGGRRRGGPHLRARGGRGARDDAERHEPGHHDVQSAVPALRAEGRGAGGVCLFRHAGGLREDGVRLPAARRARRSGDFGHQPRLQLRRERALFGDDGRGDRRQLLRLSGRRAVARQPRGRRRFRRCGGSWAACSKTGSSCRSA